MPRRSCGRRRPRPMPDRAIKQVTQQVQTTPFSRSSRRPRCSENLADFHPGRAPADDRVDPGSSAGSESIGDSRRAAEPKAN